MPNTPSAAKRMRSSAKKELRNQTTLSELKTLYKKLTVQIKSNVAEAKETARSLISKLDKAVTHGIIPHGRADRKKSRILRSLQTTKKTA